MKRCFFTFDTNDLSLIHDHRARSVAYSRQTCKRAEQVIAMSDPSVPDDPIYDWERVSFSAFFPPPYRVLLLASTGLILFAGNVKVLQSKGIDLFALFRADTAERKGRDAVYHRLTNHDDASSNDNVLPTATNGGSNHSVEVPASAQTASTMHSMLTFGLAQLMWCLLGWFSYRTYVDRLDGDPKGRHAQALQGIAVTGAFAALLWPGNLFFKPMRKAFGRNMALILSPSLAQTVTFSDVILADILTSFAKVFGDVWLTACFLVPRTEHHTWWNGKGSAAVPILISLPYLIRFRQCLAEYCTADSGRIRSKRPLWNAAKYASAFPVIWMSAWYEADKKPDSHHGQWVTRYTLWMLAVFVNSLFSFWWDVSNDWGLSILQPGNFTSVSNLSQSAGSLHRRGVSYAPVPTNGPVDYESTSLAVPMTGIAIGAAEKPLTIGTHLSPNSFHTAVTGSSSNGGSSNSSINNSNLGIGTPLHHRRNLSTVERLLRPAPSLLFPISFYQIAIVLDLVLRFLWSLKLSSHLHHIVEWQGGVFFMEFLEILRRWVWVFFRVEWEVVRRRERAKPHVAVD